MMETIRSLQQAVATSRVDQDRFQVDLAASQASNEKLHRTNEELCVEPSGVQALKNPNPLKDVEGLVVLAVVELS